MSDTLWGVVVGGGIGLVGPIIALCVQHLRWKKDLELQYLRTERARREKLQGKAIDLTLRALKDDRVDSNLTAEIRAGCPGDITALVYTVLAGMVSMSFQDKQDAFADVCMVLGLWVGEVDKNVEKSIGMKPHDSSHNRTKELIDECMPRLKGFVQDIPEAPNNTKTENEDSAASVQ